MSSTPMVFSAPQPGLSQGSTEPVQSDVVQWYDEDGRPEGLFVLDAVNGICWLQGAGVVNYTENGVDAKGQKYSIRKQIYVPNLTGTIRSVRESFGPGWTQFEAVLDIPGLSAFRAADIVGGYGYGQGSVSINLFGHRFFVRGTILTPLSGAEAAGQSNG